jgi:predicted O-methyltransferase YrrM
MLAAGCTGGRIAEVGTGPGIGTAWIAGAMPADCTLVTVEIDPKTAAVAQELMAGDDRVEVAVGDASDVLPGRGPFDLLFADCGVRTAADFAALVDLLRIGGRIVMDDLTPVRALPADSELRTDDPKRRLFGGEPRLLWTEVVFPDLANSLLVGTRVK